MTSSYVVRVFIVVLLISSTATPQTPREVRELYDRARHRYSKGDLVGAIAGYTRAIELCTRPGGDLDRSDNRFRLDLSEKTLSEHAIAVWTH